MKEETAWWITEAWEGGKKWPTSLLSSFYCLELSNTGPCDCSEDWEMWSLWVSGKKRLSEHTALSLLQCQAHIYWVKPTVIQILKDMMAEILTWSNTKWDCDTKCSKYCKSVKMQKQAYLRYCQFGSRPPQYSKYHSKVSQMNFLVSQCI